MFHARTKHIEVHHHYIREILRGEVELVPIATKDQVANIFMKVLMVPKFKKFSPMLGVCTTEPVIRGMLKIITAISKKALEMRRDWERPSMEGSGS